MAGEKSDRVIGATTSPETGSVTQLLSSINTELLQKTEPSDTQNTDQAPFAVQIDVVGTVTYIGDAAPGSATSASVWRIKRLTATGPDLAIEWADGDANFDNEWDDRLILSYS